jgi:hypothetical protein
MAARATHSSPRRAPKMAMGDTRIMAPRSAWLDWLAPRRMAGATSSSCW